MGSQIQTHIFIQGLIRKELFRHESGNIFFLYPFGHCYRHAIRRWLSPIPDMAETINWRSGAGEIKIPGLLTVENLLTSCGRQVATRAADTKSATPSILSVVLPNGEAAMAKLEVIKTQPTDGASHHYTQIPHSNGTE